MNIQMMNYDFKIGIVMKTKIVKPLIEVSFAKILLQHHDMLLKRMNNPNKLLHYQSRRI